MAVYVCSVCGWAYDEAEGAPDNGINPGTPWEQVAADFRCPICKVPKSKFEKQEEREEEAKEEAAESAPGSRTFVCSICGWTYSEAEGAPDNGIAPGTAWEDVPADFRCPICKVPKSKFEEA